MACVDYITTNSNTTTAPSVVALYDRQRSQRRQVLLKENDAGLSAWAYGEHVDSKGKGSLTTPLSPGVRTEISDLLLVGHKVGRCTWLWY